MCFKGGREKKPRNSQLYGKRVGTNKLGSSRAEVEAERYALSRGLQRQHGWGEAGGGGGGLGG